MVIGIISDTHGLLRPQAVEALRGSQLILHAGDIGKPEVLDGLARLAPVRAVRGNVARGKWADALPATETVLVAGKRLYLIHDAAELASSPPPQELPRLSAGILIVPPTTIQAAFCSSIQEVRVPAAFVCRCVSANWKSDSVNFVLRSSF